MNGFKNVEQLKENDVHVMSCSRCDEEIQYNNYSLVDLFGKMEYMILCVDCIAEIKNDLTKKIDKWTSILNDRTEKIIEAEQRDIQVRLLDCKRILKLIDNQIHVIVK